VTTNPSIFAKAVAEGAGAYAEALGACADRGDDPESAVRSLMVDDVAAACDLLAEVHARTEGHDGFVSLEVDPRLARNAPATVAQAHELWAQVDRPNLMIKIPGTAEALPAITEVLGLGINVNVTLIFSRARYGQVREAHRAGLRRAAEAGHDLRRIASVASFFVSRLDSAVDPMLEGQAALGTAGVRNALLAFADHQDDLASSEWEALAVAGARPQRPLWASTGTKDPRFAPEKYVVELLTPGAVNTVPEATLPAIEGYAGPLVPVLFDRGDPLVEDLAQAGVDYEAVVGRLERDGIAAFIDAWTALHAQVGRQLAG
jgi:transaldolase